MTDQSPAPSPATTRTEMCKSAQCQCGHFHGVEERDGELRVLPQCVMRGCACRGFRAVPAPGELDLDEMERLAKHASPGPWCTDERYPMRVYCDDSLGSMIADCRAMYAFQLPDEQKRANAAFIAFCTPERVAQLVAAARAGAADTARLDAIEGWALAYAETQDSQYGRCDDAVALTLYNDGEEGPPREWSVKGPQLPGITAVGHGETLRAAIDAAAARASRPTEETDGN